MAKRQVVDLKSACEVSSDDGRWTVRFAEFGVEGAGPSEDEAFGAMAKSLLAKLEADEALGERWQSWAQAHVIEVEVEDEPDREALVARSHAASAGFAVLNDASFDEFVDSATPSLVDFWAEWCMPCHMVSPVLKEVADELAARLRVGKVDMDAHGDMYDRFGIQGIPTMILFRGGQELHRVVGAGRSKDQLLAELEPHL